MPGTKGNKSDKKSATKQPQSPKEQPKKVIRKETITRSKEDSRRERSNNFQAFVKMALETLLGSCRRKHGGPQGRQS